MRRLGVASIACGLALLCAAASAGAASLERCAPQSTRARSLCGRVVVPLDRSGALPGTIGLRVRVLPALTPEPSGTVLALAGGPGQASARLLGVYAQLLAPALRARQLVTFDQRGTGHSGRLDCPELAALPDDGAIAPDRALENAVAGCASRLGAARAHYATADSVEDIEAVRAALGVERFALFGISYGTKVALEYAAAYPQHVERLVLDSVVPLGGTDPFARTTLGSIPRVLRSLCAHGACPFTRDPAADVAALAQRLAGAPLHGAVID
ncbi:MAG: alpha/beta fold hydrolase, partial [Conexibacter sp.]